MHGVVDSTSYTVATRDFEGPLALLLELVERDQLKVTDISVARITADYLARVHHLSDRSPESLSDFLQLGARLLYIKSLALLPRESVAEQAEELHQLNLELTEYRRYQEAARELAQMATGSSWTRPVVTRLEAHELKWPEVSLGQLGEAFERAMRRSEPTRPMGVITGHLSQETVMKRLRGRLARGPLDLQTVLDGARDRLEVIVTFLAILELMRAAELHVVQAGQFGPMVLEVVGA